MSHEQRSSGILAIEGLLYGKDLGIELPDDIADTGI